jgi:hypothetical protein
LRIKSYFAGTVEAAMERARRELGDEAVLLNARLAPPEARHLGLHEVVFGADAPEEPAVRRIRDAGRGPAPAAVASAPPSALPGGIRHFVRDLEAYLEREWCTLGAAGASLETPHQPFEVALERMGYPAGFRRRVSEAAFALSGETLAADGPDGVDADLEPVYLEPVDTGAGDWFARAPGSLARSFLARGARARSLLSALAECFPGTPDDAQPGGAPRTVVLLGPAGSGRTSLAVKLAAEATALRGGRALLVDCGPARPGGRGPLETYAAIIGADFAAAGTPAEFREACAAAAPGQWVFADAAPVHPGRDPSPEMREWSEAWESGELPGERHLVLPAYLAEAQWPVQIGRFARFRPEALALTRLDECPSLALAVAASASCGLPLSWLSGGPGVMRCHEWTTLERWLDLAVGNGVVAPAGMRPPPQGIELREEETRA